MRAIIAEDVEEVRALLEGGADPNFSDETRQFTVLDLAISLSDDVCLRFRNRDSGYAAYLEIVTLLLRAGADVNGRSELSETPLLCSIRWKGNVELTRILLEAGADVNAKDAQGRTALQKALKIKNSAFAKKSNADAFIKLLTDFGATT